MQFRRIKLRLRRRLRKGQQQVEDLGVQAEQQIEEHIFKRFERLASVRRFVISWVLLLVLLISGVVIQNISLSNYYQTLRPVPGGIYNEGVLGTFTNANPLYASSSADSTVSRLLFAGLLKYDDQNKLVGDLASDYSVDTTRGVTYTVHLKPHLTWQDGQPLTSADVVYTYQMIQNPDAKSPLQASWQGIKVTATDSRTVVFTLPGPLASFPYNMTNGIVPQHLLGSIPPADLRSADFNTVHPVGAGPFSWQAIQVAGGTPATAREQIALVPFDGYQGGKPKLQEFVVHVYADQAELVRAFQKNQLTAVMGLTDIPRELQTRSSVQVHNISLTAATMVFFKTSTGVLADTKLRQALVQASNVPHIISNLGYPTHAVREPLLTGQLAYDPSLVQSGFNIRAARTALDSDGWVVGKNGIRTKAGQRLSFSLSASNTPEYRGVTNQLKEQWRAVGADVTIQLQEPNDFQSTLSYHSYDAVLYGISIGVDPDVFVYWDSSQADIRSANRLNLSEYKNTTADAALEAGRTRLDPSLRTVKYKPFLQAWQQDNPALGLYQPRLLYLTNGTVAGLSDHSINTVIGRFNNIENWEIRQAKVTNN